jgi:hypothetical protein
MAASVMVSSSPRARFCASVKGISRSVRRGPGPPALFTSTSMGPKRSTAAATMRRQLSASAQSPTTVAMASGSKPSAASVRAKASSFSPSRPVITSRAPSRRSRREM